LTEKEKSKLKKMKATAIDSDDEDEGIVIIILPQVSKFLNFLDILFQQKMMNRCKRN
jgi:hypothetical protein